MYGYRIQVNLWPQGSMFAGKRISDTLLVPTGTQTVLDLEIADAELLARDWARSADTFEQEAARSINAALHEWRVERTKEVDANVPY